MIRSWMASMRSLPNESTFTDVGNIIEGLHIIKQIHDKSSLLHAIYYSKETNDENSKNKENKKRKWNDEFQLTIPSDTQLPHLNDTLFNIFLKESDVMTPNYLMTQLKLTRLHNDNQSTSPDAIQLGLNLANSSSMVIEEQENLFLNNTDNTFNSNTTTTNITTSTSKASVSNSLKLSNGVIGDMINSYPYETLLHNVKKALANISITDALGYDPNTDSIPMTASSLCSNCYVSDNSFQRKGIKRSKDDDKVSFSIIIELTNQINE